jgi:hypothetical protein
VGVGLASYCIGDDGEGEAGDTGDSQSPNHASDKGGNMLGHVWQAGEANKGEAGAV